MAAFASWQFRLLASEESEVLDPNTLREMHRVHWVDEDWKVSWGLGFVVYNVDGTTLVGHTGGCPGYITSFMLVPKYKLAAIALTNAADGAAQVLTTAMLKIIGPALAAAAKPAAPKDSESELDVDLEAYTGNFTSGIWGGEVAVRVWGQQLAAVSLPSDELAEITKLKHVADDTFVRLTKDGEEREPWEFQRDQSGRVMGLLRHSNVARRVE